MRETRTSGSEGGGTDWSSLPLSLKLIPQCQRIWPGPLPCGNRWGLSLMNHPRKLE